MPGSVLESPLRDTIGLCRASLIDPCCRQKSKCTKACNCFRAASKACEPEKPHCWLKQNSIRPLSLRPPGIHKSHRNKPAKLCAALRKAPGIVQKVELSLSMEAKDQGDSHACQRGEVHAGLSGVYEFQASEQSPRTRMPCL